MVLSSIFNPTKFIVSDEPVTFFNRHIFPSECVYPGGIELDKIGTRTLFPLGPDACLLITHVQLVRDPWIKPLTVRENARSYDRTLKKLTDIQTGRELEEDEVRRINFILKTRATRYIAASKEEWLYPERHVCTTDWAKLDGDCATTNGIGTFRRSWSGPKNVSVNPWRTFTQSGAAIWSLTR
jgi:hypothetical protein